MPRQNKVRQRGKKHKKNEADAAGKEAGGWHPSGSTGASELPESSSRTAAYGAQTNGDEQLPAWMGSADAGSAEVDPQAPFGYVDADLKAYLRSAVSSLTALYASSSATESRDVDDQYAEAQDASSREERIQLRDAALKEINGVELAVATDPDTSRVLELLIDTMSEKQVRIFADRLAGSLSILAGHRFGSHVLQSTLRALQRACSSVDSRDASEKGKSSSDGDKSQGVLRNATTLIAEMTEELLPALGSLIHDQFGTHIVRSLLLVLSGRALDDSLRSKRSAAYRSKGEFVDLSSTLPDAKQGSSVPLFESSMESVQSALLQDLGANEVRALSISPTASPTLQLLLELQGDSSQPEGPTDRVLDGLLTLSAKSAAPSERSAHVEALLRDVVGSHLLQNILGLLEDAALRLFWKIYIEGRISKLGTHPLANFVVASAIKRLPLETDLDRLALEQAVSEVATAGAKLVGEGRIGILTALVERVSGSARAESSTGSQSPELGSLRTAAVSSVASGFGIDAERVEQRIWLVPAILAIKPRKVVTKERERARKRKEAKESSKAEEGDAADAGAGKSQRDSVEIAKEEQEPVKDLATLGWHREEELQDSDVKVQGSVLLQAIASARAPANAMLYESLMALPSSLPLAKSHVASYVLIAALTSDTATFKQRKDLIAWMQPDLHLLADAAPRVAYTLWDKSDGFTKERHARFLLSREKFLLASPRGRTFLKRSVNLALFRRSVGEWKKWLAEQAHSQSQTQTQTQTQMAKQVVAPVPIAAGSAQTTAHAKKRKAADMDAGTGKGTGMGTGGAGELQTSAEVEVPEGSHGKVKKSGKKVKRQTDLELDAILAGV